MAGPGGACQSKQAPWQLGHGVGSERQRDYTICGGCFSVLCAGVGRVRSRTPTKAEGRESLGKPGWEMVVGKDLYSARCASFTF